MTTLGRYRLVKELAEGGMGVVYRGIDTGWGGAERPVAVKLLAPALARDPEFIGSFQQEARISFQVAHPNVVQVLDIGQIDETCFMVMEWVNGVDLRTVHKRLAERQERFPTQIATFIAIEVARGLDYAHRLGDGKGRALELVHRDVSASNILVSWEGAVKLTDFGIATSRLHKASLRPGSLKGKIGYMSPEQAGGGRLDPRSDVFSLGVVLYELVTGANPFTSGRTEADALAHARSCTFDPPRERNPRVDPALERIVLRAMSARPEDRYPTAAALRDDLEAFARAESFVLGGTELSALLRRMFEVDQVAQAETPAAAAGFSDLLASELAGAGSGGATPTTDTRVERPPAAPRSAPPRSGAWLVAVAALGAAVAIAAAWTWRAHRDPPIAVLAPARPPAPIPPPVVVASPPAVATAPPPVAPPPRSDARLTIKSDIVAKVFVDGRFVQNTPVRDLSLPPGVHRVRLEGSSFGLHLLPREQSVRLAAGDRRTVTIDLAGGSR